MTEGRQNQRIIDASTTIEEQCVRLGLRMTGQRRVIAQVLSASEDHPAVDAVFQRANAIDPRISLSTVYRTLKLFSECGILERHSFGAGPARYEETPEAHHDHLIDIDSGEVIEFHSPEIELLQEQIAEKLGYTLVGHRLELFARARKGPGESGGNSNS